MSVRDSFLYSPWKFPIQCGEQIYTTDFIFHQLRKSFLPTKFLQFTLNGSYIFELLKNPDLGSFLQDFLQHLCINPLKKNHYTYVAQWAIFMDQKLRFGLVLGLLAILKKKWSIMSNFWRRFFLSFHGQKQFGSS